MADINRKTFYRYYISPEDIMKEIVDCTISRIFGNDFGKIDFEKLFQNPEIIFQQLNELMEEDFQTYEILFKIKGPENLLQKIQILLKEKLIAFFLEKSISDTTDIMIFCEFCSAGIIGAYRYWFCSSQKIPLEELSQKVCDMIKSCMETLSIKI